MSRGRGDQTAVVVLAAASLAVSVAQSALLAFYLKGAKGGKSAQPLGSYARPFRNRSEWREAPIGSTGVSPVPPSDPHAPPTPAHGMPHIR
ncbi:MAG TPA: hypothetical protein VIL55_04190 [Naasia sp.]|jgi:hypothetical protein